MKSFKDCISYFNNLILNDLPDGCCVAGGAVLDYFMYGHCRSSKDIDIFFDSKETFEKASNIIVEKTGKWHDYLIPEVVTNFKLNGLTIQFVATHFYDSPAKTIDSFDFTVCAAAVDKNEVYLDKNFMNHLDEKKLFFINQLTQPVGTLNRLPRYIKKGFDIDKEALLLLAEEIRGMDDEDFDNVYYE